MVSLGKWLGRFLGRAAQEVTFRSAEEWLNALVSRHGSVSGETELFRRTVKVRGEEIVLRIVADVKG